MVFVVITMGCDAQLLAAEAAPSIDPEEPMAELSPDLRRYSSRPMPATAATPMMILRSIDQYQYSLLKS